MKDKRSIGKLFFSWNPSSFCSNKNNHFLYFTCPSLPVMFLKDSCQRPELHLHSLFFICQVIAFIPTSLWTTWSDKRCSILPQPSLQDKFHRSTNHSLNYFHITVNLSKTRRLITFHFWLQCLECEMTEVWVMFTSKKKSISQQRAEKSGFPCFPVSVPNPW